MNQHLLEVADQRVSGDLRWLTLQAPQLARSVRPGQYLLVRCAGAGSYDPLLRRPLFVAAAEEAIGQIGLLYEPNERGLQWLARALPGETLDILGPFGEPFELGRGTRTLLMLGEGLGIAALLLLSAHATRRGCSVTLLAGALRNSLLPPPFLLPADVEYQTIVGRAIDLLRDPQTEQNPLDSTSKTKRKQAVKSASPPMQPTLINWADQVAATLPRAQLGELANTVRATKFRWERGFAQVLVESPLVCGVGACGVCASELRGGTRLLCVEGPVVDLRDL